MSCVRHFMALQWERHDWSRHVSQTESLAFRSTDQWGRSIPADHVTCHTQYICRDCGAVRDDGECSCDRPRAERCAVRLERLAELRGQDQGARP